MYTYPWYHWITFFYIYCFFGWIFESTYVSLKSRRFVNRGFLRLPMLPLYGTGAVMMLWFSLPVKDNLFLVYLAGVVAATILEYATGYVMERLFKMKYWDYSNQPFNLNGYICLSSSIAWGFLTIFLTDVIHKPIANAVLQMNPVVEFTFIGIISILFVSDSVQSTREALDLGRALEAMTKIRNELEEVQVQLALLKAETSQRVAEFKEDASHRVNGSLGDTAPRMSFSLEDLSDSLEGTAQKISDSLSDAVSRVNDIKEETVQRVADMKEETAQRMADMKEGTVQRVADMKEGTIQRVADMKEETVQRVTEAAQRFIDRGEREASLSERLKTLTENRQALSNQMSFYRKGILRGNPTSSSSKFAEALKEFKEAVNSRKNSGHTEE